MTHFSIPPEQRPIDNRPVLDRSASPQRDMGDDFKTTNPQPLSALVAQFEASVIDNALCACNGNQAKAAKLLGVAPNTLHYKLKRLGLVSARKNADGMTGE